MLEYDSLFFVSHELNNLIEREINNVKEIQKNQMFSIYNFDISAKQISQSDFELGKCVKTSKQIYQYAYISTKFLIPLDNYILHSKRNVFVKKTVDKTIDSIVYTKQISKILKKLNLIDDEFQLEQRIIKQITFNPNKYKFFSEELLYLKYLKSDEGTIWLESKASESFRCSEAYIKIWSNLLNNCNFDKEGYPII